MLRQIFGQYLFLPLAVMVSVTSSAALVAAQTTDETPRTEAEEPEEGEGNPGPSPFFGETPGPVDPEVTASTVSSISAAARFCAALPGTFQVDCLSERLMNISQRLRNEPGMAEASKALMDASQSLNRVAWANMSTTQEPTRFRDQTTSAQNTRPIIPVSESRVDSALAQADVILDQTETVLLRSAEGSADRAVQYQRIAEAINSDKVLLRS